MARTTDQPDIRERLLAGAAEVLSTDGVEGLTVRRVVEAAGRSTMCVYTKFGGRSGLMNAVYEQAADSLYAVLERSRPVDGSAALGLAAAYRRFALANPGAYALLFDQALPALGIDEPLRGDAIARVGAFLAAAGESEALRFWALMHGLLALERSLPRPPAGDWKGFYLQALGARPGEAR
ncbi:TetR/AcrR family transcriptional regulator [Streptomyces sp. SID13031]|uniref:TetR/AcrR family transcriptional regulator n=1 Tax=Streptomyces sp. SID13031 TaxID=2706046 RepID=UPI0013CCA31F|nr:TetR/AcrR family transcriptional regulator [Streptomyces sp. SID13031]NEA37498.1 helix-turn-helix transcriptional regulator [Streptomyces sp. SID13031]